MEGNLRKCDIDEKSQGYWDNYELSPGEKRWKKHMEAVRQAVYSDPFHAISGRRSLWDSFLSERGYGPSNTVQDLSAGSAGSSSSSGWPSRTFSTNSQASKDPNFGGYAESSSFSYSSKKEPGKAPVVEATSTKWNSATNSTITYRYDPVTSRMVPVDDATSQQSNVESLSAKSIRDRMGDGAAVVAGEESKQRSAHQSDMARGFDASSSAVDDQIRHAQQTLSEADGYSTEPIGMQTSFSEETTASTNEQQPTLAQQIASQAIAVEESDGYSKQPMGMQTSYTNETGDDTHASLAEELSTNTEQKDIDDGYSQDPVGMQTNYSTELQDSERLPLDEELSSNTTPIDVDDGYSKQPIGMQTSYTTEMEDQGESALEQELSSNTKEVNVDDGYSRTPIGMQTSFLVEQEECDQDQRVPLEEELSADQVPKDVTEGTSLKPASTYKFVDVRIRDEYSKAPVGMQTSYTEEQQACADKKQVPLEQEISESLVEAEMSDGYSREPKGMQTSYQYGQDPLEEELAGRLAPEKFDDGYSDKPIGMETSYDHEQQDCAEHRRVPLEEEIASPTPEFYDDGYTVKPTGLQNTYEQEHKDVDSHVRRSLAEEIEYNDKVAAEAHSGLAGQYKDGYTNLPSGLQTSYNEEHTESTQGGRQSLEEELRFQASNSETPRGVQFLYGQNAGYDDPAAPGLLKHQQRIAAEEALANELEAQKTAKGAYEGRQSAAKPRVSKETKRPFHASSGAYEKTLQGEGDISANASDFTSSDRWYKQTSSGGTVTSNENLVQDIVRIATEGGLLKQHSELQAIQDQVMAKLRSLENRINNVSADMKTISDETPSFTWADPPAYKILAYDSGNDAIETVTTTSRFAEKEEPISVANAMSKVLEPARFVSYYAGLQREGYQAIHASENLLVFRKVQQPTESAALKSNAINPVDGTARQPATGNFASPTGFVNHDPVFPIEDSTSAVLHELPTNKEPPEIEDGIYFRRRQHPRVHRQESVFSGRRVRDHQHHEDNGHQGSRQRGFRRERRPAWKRRVRFAVSVGLTSAALVYALGVGAELARGDKEKKKTSRFSEE